MSKSPPKAPDDPGAFGTLSPKQKRTLEGAVYLVTASIAKTKRRPNDWSISYLFSVHRELFERVFSEHAGKERQKDVAFRSHAVPTPGQIKYRLTDIVKDAAAIVEEAHSIKGDEERIEAILPKIARFHADCVVLQPFIDGNKRWARAVLNALLVGCGFWPGTRIKASEKERYMDGIDKAVAGEPEQLAELIIEGWLDLEEDFASGTY